MVKVFLNIVYIIHISFSVNAFTKTINIFFIKILKKIIFLKCDKFKEFYRSKFSGKNKYIVIYVCETFGNEFLII